jgi:demethylmenaquinone methyltransferase/2-methoxy-6-polyprenyl-1,4-benzoquinol methylase
MALEQGEGLGAETGTAFDAHSATPQQKEAWVHQTFERISERYDLMNDLESFGLHRAWKRTLISAVRALKPQTVLDVASGTGDIALALAQAVPQAQVTGLDFSKNMLDVARKRARAASASARTARTRSDAASADGAGPDAGSAADKHIDGSPKDGASLSFVQGNAMDMPFENDSFDVVVVSFGLRNMPDYQRSIEEMTRVLRPGGSLFCLEASYPTAPIIKPAFRVYFKHIMPQMARLVTRKRAEYRWLNDSTELFLSKPQLAALMERYGLSNVRYRSFALGAAALHHGVKLFTAS